MKYERICLTCGTRFKSNNNRKKYCSTECQRKRAANKRVRILECPVCWRVMAVKGNRTYCSTRCKELAKKWGISKKYTHRVPGTEKFENTSHLEDDNQKAKVLGLSYGMYMALKEGRG